MNTAKSISGSAPEPGTLNFSQLLETGIARVQSLSGDLWTDFNDHDPGVTILQQLCFALTDLAYRTEHPIEDLLEHQQSVEDLQQHVGEAPRTAPPQAFFTGDQVLTCNPLTLKDFRKLLYDQVEDLKNVWLEPVVEQASGYPGRYRVLIDLYDSPAPSPCSEQGLQARRRLEQKDVIARVGKLLHQHRNLGEDFAGIEVVEALEFSIQAEVEVDPEVEAVDVVADILFNVDWRLNPPPEIEDLDSLLQRGEAPEELFEGPNLGRGVIRDGSLKDRVSAVFVDQIMGIMLAVKGVREVRDLTLITSEGSPSGGNKMLTQATAMLRPSRQSGEGSSSVPRVATSDQAIAALRIFQGADEGTITAREDAEWVRSSLRHRQEGERWKAIYARERNQDSSYKRVPRGNPDRQLLRYRSIQHLFPGVYGIGVHGVAGSSIIRGVGPVPDPKARQKREAQARQLKAYLLFFEQLMADYLAQLANASRLLSLDPVLKQSYFFQPLAHQPSNPDDPPNVASVLMSGQEPEPCTDRKTDTKEGASPRPQWLYEHERSLGALVRQHDPYHDRRERTLDHLLARFNEYFDDARLERLHRVGQGQQERDALFDQRIAWKRDFLAEYPRLSGDRGLGTVYTRIEADQPLKTVTPLVLRRRIALLTGVELDFHVVEHVLLRPCHPRPGIGELEIGCDFRVACVRHALQIADAGWLLHWVLDSGDLQGDWGVLIDSVITREPDYEYAHGPDKLRSRFLDPTSGQTVYLLEGFASVAQARDANDRLRQLLLRIACGEASMAEHVRGVELPLRFGAHKLSVFLSPVDGDNKAAEGRGADFREFVEDTVMANLPAHLSAECYWLDCAQMGDFEYRYERWIADRAKLLLPQGPVKNKDLEKSMDREARGLRRIIGKHYHDKFCHAQQWFWRGGACRADRPVSTRSGGTPGAEAGNSADGGSP
jgi:hypothetical protein